MTCFDCGSDDVIGGEFEDLAGIRASEEGKWDLSTDKLFGIWIIYDPVDICKKCLAEKIKLRIEEEST